MELDRLITRALAGILVLMASGYLFRTLRVRPPQAEPRRLAVPAQESGAGAAPQSLLKPANAPSSDQIAAGVVPAQAEADPNTAPPGPPRWQDAGSNTVSGAKRSGARKTRARAAAGDKAAAGEYWTQNLDMPAPSKSGPGRMTSKAPGAKKAGPSGAAGQQGTDLPGQLQALLDSIPPDIQAAAKKAPYLLGRYRDAMRELTDAIGGSRAVYQAVMNGDFSKLGGAYAERAEQDARDKTVYNPGGPCGDYPLKWCKTAPNAVISFGGGPHLNRQCESYVAWKRWSTGQKIVFGSAGAWPGSSQIPDVGGAAIWDSGPAHRYGHLAYVTVAGAGSITIVEFNHKPYVYTSRTIKRGSSSWPDRFMPR